MAEGQEPQGPEAEVSEAQTAVHWREEEIYPPPAAFSRQANAADPAIFGRFGEDKFPDCFLAYDAGHQQPAVLEVVRGGAG
jgi:hypothetical protein